ncbi:hypothetical protein [Candidatus Thiodictyon syntrophicum]|jgi:hypothetical protein|uniref:Uncharacterized protein n=1 Tax=Candidatus Thiodictyon syntrophicum TaxID=1166950 RepID=A0A2K8UBM0_9GAMM|nr:hypothetical protein [Candidatus Thiodictyon syntrophicum]AUB82927.1 hypothetical protein THSYN_19585 [Candidatus Thiodictyon syntrophicum]
MSHPLTRTAWPLLALLLSSPGAPRGAEGTPLALPPPPGAAPAPTAPAPDRTGNAADLWQRTRDTAGTWWQRSRDLAGQAVQDAGGLMGPKPQGFPQVWEGVVPKLQETLVLEERRAALPDSAWFSADKVSNQAQIEALLDDAVTILSTSPVQRFRERIRAIQGEIDAARAAIADYRQNRVAAPTESTIKRTVADYDRLIAEKEAQIKRLNEQLGQVKREFAAAVRQLGVDLSDEQVEFLLSTVVGDNMVDLGILFDNVKSVTNQLEQLVAQSGEDLQSARRYYGMYVVLLRALERMHQKIEEAIGEQYIPQINAIITRAEQLTGETRDLQRSSPGKGELLAANLEAQRLTIEAAGVYRQYLNDQKAQVIRARLELEKDIAAAWNTFETVRVSGELVGLVKSSRRLLEGLMNRQVPALRPFENLEMRREFEKLTEQLRRGG